MLIEELKYEIYDDLKNLKVLKIKTADETISDLINQNVSICRFGDGELNLMKGEDIISQNYSPQLAER